MPSSSTQVERWRWRCRASALRRGHLIDAPPRAGQAFDVGGGAGLGEVQQRGLVLRSGDAGQRPDLGVGDRPALHRGAHARERRQRVGDADLLAGGAQGDARAPVQPMRTGGEAVVPPGALVELAQQHEQLVGGGMEPRRQRGDLLAERVGRERRGPQRDVRGRRNGRVGERWRSSYRILASQYLPRQIGRRRTNPTRSTVGRGTTLDRARQGRRAAWRRLLDRGANHSRVAPENLSSTNLPSPRDGTWRLLLPASPIKADGEPPKATVRNRDGWLTPGVGYTRASSWKAESPAQQEEP